MGAYTWNPDDKSTSIALSSQNRVATALTTSGEYAVRATDKRGAGKWYFDVLIGSGCSSGSAFQIGLMRATASIQGGVGNSGGGVSYDLRGYTYLSGAYGYMGITATAGNVIGVAWDSVAGKIWFSKNNNWMSGNPASGTSPQYNSAELQAELYPAVSFYGPHVSANISSMTGNFNSTTFAYSPPAGFEPYGLVQIPIGGNVTKLGGGAGDAVVIIDATTKGTVAVAIPDENGDWASTITDDYYVLYLGNDCQPIAHGPYIIA